MIRENRISELNRINKKYGVDYVLQINKSDVVEKLVACKKNAEGQVNHELVVIKKMSDFKKLETIAQYDSATKSDSYDFKRLENVWKKAIFRIENRGFQSKFLKSFAGKVYFAENRLGETKDFNKRIWFQF
jgi:hypothetical protein